MAGSWLWVHSKCAPVPVCSYTCSYMHCVHVCALLCMCTCVYVHVHAYGCVCVCVCVCACDIKKVVFSWLFEWAFFVSLLKRFITSNTNLHKFQHCFRHYKERNEKIIKWIKNVGLTCSFKWRFSYLDNARPTVTPSTVAANVLWGMHI